MHGTPSADDLLARRDETDAFDVETRDASFVLSCVRLRLLPRSVQGPTDWIEPTRRVERAPHALVEASAAQDLADVDAHAPGQFS